MKEKHTWHSGCHIVTSTHRLIVSWSSNLQLLSHEVYAIESHPSSSFINGSEFYEGEVLVQVDLACENWVSWSLSQTTQVHLE